MKLIFRRTTDPAPRTLDLYDVAYLAGGPRRMMEVALVALHERGIVRIRSSRVHTLDGAGDPDGHPFEHAVAELCRYVSRRTRHLLEAIETGPEVEEIERRMVSCGLLTPRRLRLTRAGKWHLGAAERSGAFPGHVFEGPAALPKGALRRNVSEGIPSAPGLTRRLLHLGGALDSDNDGIMDLGGGHHSCGGGHHSCGGGHHSCGGGGGGGSD
ncbi:TIGR04222 domain-containing membrane protein [Streptomyces sp. NPDC007983]|uniref:TIGR04222 domain-containing membrane protein n=1 Tax=Streptomyces sp. NPDC007983 TaxID=3364800 RepID=UPI0036DFC972